MGIKGFERSLENMVEGAFARVFRSGLRPVELGRRLVREMDDNRSVDVRGRTIVPNAFAITVSQDDYDRFAEIGDSLTRELSDAAREHAHDEALRRSWARSPSTWNRRRRPTRGRSPSWGA